MELLLTSLSFLAVCLALTSLIYAYCFYQKLIAERAMLNYCMHHFEPLVACFADEVMKEIKQESAGN